MGRHKQLLKLKDLIFQNAADQERALAEEIWPLILRNCDWDQVRGMVDRLKHAKGDKARIVGNILIEVSLKYTPLTPEEIENTRHFYINNLDKDPELRTKEQVMQSLRCERFIKGPGRVTRNPNGQNLVRIKN